VIAAAATAVTPRTPASTYRAVTRGVVAGSVVWLVGLAAVAWFVTVRQAGTMDDMASGLGQVGGLAANDMEPLVFLGMWVGMMVAMMFPTVVPLVLAHRLVLEKRGEGLSSTVAMVVGYLSVWAVVGVIPLAVFLWFRDLSAEAIDSWWRPTLAGGVIVVAGVYQFTAWKARCLRVCQTPLTFVLNHDFGGGARRAFRAGVTNGLWCVGCCWALMSVLVVVGLMNLVWMAGLALVFLLEKHSPRPGLLTGAVGTGLILLGLVVIAAPELLPVVSGVPDSLPSMADTGGM
jgi:predicted metal-binding membrane protein